MKQNKLSNKIVRVALYIRVSTQEQVREGYSLKSQQQRLTEYCNDKGYKIIELYADEGKTARAKLKNRKALLKLAEDATNNHFDRVVFWRLDRWFRNVADYYKIQEVLENNNVDWECSDEEYNTTTSNGRLMLNMKLSINQNESDQTSDRIKFNFEQMIKNGNPIQGAHCFPLGFKIVGEKKQKRIVHDETTEHIVYDMFDKIEMFGSIRKTLIYINSIYNLEILYDSMCGYFKSTFYYGSYRKNNNYCEPYITKERWDNIQNIIKKNTKHSKKRYDYIFSGLIKCNCCNRNMSGFILKTTKPKYNKSYEYPYYRCNYHYNSKLCKNSHTISENQLENWLIKNLKTELNKYIISINSIDNKKIKESINTEKLEKKLDRLNELYIDGRIDKEKYNKEYDHINEIIATTKKSKQKKRDLKPYYEILNKPFIDIYNQLNNAGKRAFWLKFINYIEKDEKDNFKIFFK